MNLMDHRAEREEGTVMTWTHLPLKEVHLPREVLLDTLVEAKERDLAVTLLPARVERAERDLNLESLENLVKEREERVRNPVKERVERVPILHLLQARDQRDIPDLVHQRDQALREDTLDLAL